MWRDIATWVLGALGLAVSANLFARRSTRQVAELKAQGELLQVLPDGDGKVRMTAYVQRRTAALADRLEHSESHWSERWEPTLARVWWAGSGLATAGWVGALQESPPEAVEVGAVLLLFVGAVLLSVSLIGLLSTNIAAGVRWVRRTRSGSK